MLGPIVEPNQPEPAETPDDVPPGGWATVLLSFDGLTYDGLQWFMGVAALGGVTGTESVELDYDDNDPYTSVGFRLTFAIDPAHKQIP